MTATIIRQKLYDYIRVAEDKKIKAIYTMLEGEIEEVHDYWQDKGFLGELDRRASDYKSGKIKGIPWEDVKLQIEKSTKRRKK